MKLSNDKAAVYTENVCYNLTEQYIYAIFSIHSPPPLVPFSLHFYCAHISSRCAINPFLFRK
jgi:hypothetical protein